MTLPPAPSHPFRGGIVVMGVSGCGKTTLAQQLATALACPFIEGDALHDARCVAKMAAGTPLTDEDRAPWLDRVGMALGEAAARHGVAVAACSALRQAYRDRLRAAMAAPVAFVLLDAPAAPLAARLARRSGHFMPASLLDSQLATLERPLPGEQALHLDARLTPGELVAATLAWLSAAARTASGA